MIRTLKGGMMNDEWGMRNDEFLARVVSQAWATSCEARNKSVSKSENWKIGTNQYLPYDPYSKRRNDEGGMMNDEWGMRNDEFLARLVSQAGVPSCEARNKSENRGSYYVHCDRWTFLLARLRFTPTLTLTLTLDYPITIRLPYWLSVLKQACEASRNPKINPKIEKSV